MQHLRRGILMLLVILTLGYFLVTPAAQGYERYSVSFFGSFDTVISILGFAPDVETFEKVTAQAEESFARLHKYYDKYNHYDGVVNVHTLNLEAAKAPVKVPDELFDLIKYSVDMYAHSRNMVNIALGTVLNLWHDARETAEESPEKAYIPDMAALREAARHCDIGDVVLDEKEKTVFFADPLLQLDVGAVAKGFAAELVARQMLGSEITSFIINAGGNVRVGNPPMDGRKNWGVAIQDPDGFVLSDANTDIMDILFLRNMSVVTSGDYQRNYMYNGIRYHHIIHPITLMPPDYFRSVSIVTEDSAYADLLSTTLFLMPYEEGRAYVEALDGVEALWILSDRSIQMTQGLMDSAKSQGATNP